ncbi:FAD-dependent oxidoreductase [Mucilaginibacter ginsenosidivorax]|uniref:FAD-dependent oxidoreductase n=1 Tax=Mucilaginibacter ginsenosidivorax TaxID=862126 RepID=A0A5B8W8K9_9SPHI|nr:FAD-dependent oxidoreductase [Mucilaginibacter ginsenosidivorax]QEC80234.1 FAD-dependent oxidoreductase [Mucilaginibacter ginsenosidivorax]
MRNFKVIILLIIVTHFCAILPARAQSTKAIETDVCIYGGTCAGVIAAYTAKKMGKTVVLVEPGNHLGGMTSGGLGYTDIGNKYVVTGLARDFYRKIGQHYGKFEQWIFEPKVAEAIFNQYVKTAGFTVLMQNRLIKVTKHGNLVTGMVVENSLKPTAVTNITIKAKEFIDCTYEGDLMARSGVSYTVGREANSQYHETINGVEVMDGHQFPDGIDPYKIPGDPKSGLLWGISGDGLQTKGSGDKKVQAYNFRITLTNVPENRIDIAKPKNYDPQKYELLLRLKEKDPWKSINDVLIISKMPNGKTDINNKGGFSTDMIGMNWEYPEADYQKRLKIQQAHETYTKGFLYFLGNDPRIPANIRNEMKQWGYPKDEYTDNGNWTPQLYIREARRMIGQLVMTQQYCQGKEVANDGIGMAAYTMDSHNCDRQVVDGMAKNEGNVEVGGFGPYPVSYRAIVPKPAEATNILVPVCLSASHIAYGSIRMEPVFMVLGQSAAVAACQAIDRKIAVQMVDVTAVQKLLKNNPLADGRTPEVLVDNDDTAHVQITGDWKIAQSGGYGPTYFIDTAKAGPVNSVKFRPDIVKNGSYNVYAYFPKAKNASAKTHITIFDGTNATEKIIDQGAIQVEGQTSGEWVALGLYSLSKSKQAYVQISNKNADGVTVADAVLFVPAR